MSGMRSEALGGLDAAGGASVDQSVLDWLLHADPAIRWQVLRDITGGPADAVAAERARVATHGWGADLLARQTVDGEWAAIQRSRRGPPARSGSRS